MSLSGSPQLGGGLGGDLRVSRTDGSGGITLLIAGTAQLFEALGCPLARRVVEHCSQESAKHLVLAWAVDGAVAVRGEQRLSYVMARVVGEVALVLRSREVRQVCGDVIGLLEERGYTTA